MVEDLKQEVERECGLLIYGKTPGSGADYTTIAHKNLTDKMLGSSQSFVPFHPMFRTNQLQPGTELIRYIDARILIKEGNHWIYQSPTLDELVVGAPKVEASFMHYTTHMAHIDADRRYYFNNYTIIIPRELTLEIIDFARKEPKEVQKFFLELHKGANYKAKFRNGVLNIINGNKIAPDSDGKIRIPENGCNNPDICEEIEYGAN